MKRLLLLALLLAQVASGQTFTGPHRTTGPALIQQNIGANLKRSMVSYWSFDEASGIRADSLGRNNLAESSASVASAAGIKGNAASFASATGKWLQKTASLVGMPVGSQSFSMVVWVNFSSLADLTNGILGPYKSPGGCMLYQKSAIIVQGQCSDGTAREAPLTKNPWPTGVWEMWHVYYNQATGKMGATCFGADLPCSATGVSATEVAWTAAWAPTALYAGSYAGSSNQVPDALVDESFIVVGRVVQQNELLWIFNAGAGRAYSEY